MMGYQILLNEKWALIHLIPILMVMDTLMGSKCRMVTIRLFQHRTINFKPGLNMKLELQCEDFPLTDVQVGQLLATTEQEIVGSERSGMVAIRCVSKDEIRTLNAKYRNKDVPTNILTFSYEDNEHDV